MPSSDDPNAVASVAIIGEQVRAMRGEITEIKGSISEINRAIDKLATLEVEHLNTRSAMTRAFNAIDATNAEVRELDKRIRPLEIAQPGLLETRKWVISVAAVSLATLLGALLALVLRPAPTLMAAPVVQQAPAVIAQPPRGNP